MRAKKKGGAGFPWGTRGEWQLNDPASFRTSRRSITCRQSGPEEGRQTYRVIEQNKVKYSAGGANEVYAAPVAPRYCRCHPLIMGVDS